MFSPLAFSSLAMDVCIEAVATRLSVCDVAFDATCVTRNTGKFCALPWGFGHRVSVLWGICEPTSVRLSTP
jgi:hypothetical protein